MSQNAGMAREPVQAPKAIIHVFADSVQDRKSCMGG